MGADVDVSRWVLEFVLRQPEMDDLARKLLAVLPISDDDLRLKKTVLLRALECEVAGGSVTESVLEILEILEELDKSQGNAIPDSMRDAYCTAAVECTVKFLVSSGGKPGGEYSKALDRIWRGRIGRLERYGKSKLVAGEVKKRWDEVNSALEDGAACRKLCRMNTRNDALFSIHGYLEEAWGLIGPPFLELADGLMNKKKRVDIECDGREFDDLAVQNLAAQLLVNHEEGSILSQEICEEDALHDSHRSDIQCLEVQALRSVQVCDSLENKSGDLEQEVDEANSSPYKRTEVPQSSHVHIGNQSCRNPEKVRHCSLRERNRALQNYKGEESNDESPEPAGSRERTIQPHSQKRGAVSLLKNGTKKRRKNKRWSLREEDILRTSVESFGRNWKFILNMHRDEFEERTEVDLKDKWRNMMKNC